MFNTATLLEKKKDFGPMIRVLVSQSRDYGVLALLGL
jgi:hypothetical protein